jgi:hypothetical protein
MTPVGSPPQCRWLCSDTGAFTAAHPRVRRRTDVPLTGRTMRRYRPSRPARVLTPSTPFAYPGRFTSFDAVSRRQTQRFRTSADFFQRVRFTAAPPARISRRVGWLISTRAAEESAEADNPARPTDGRPTRGCQHGSSGIAEDAIPPIGTYANPYANQPNTRRLSVNVRRCPQASKIASELQGSATPADTRAHV